MRFLPQVITNYLCKLRAGASGVAAVASDLCGVGFAGRLTVRAAIIAVLTRRAVASAVVASLPIVCHLILPPGWISVPPKLILTTLSASRLPASGQSFEKDPDDVSERSRRRADQQSLKTRPPPSGHRPLALKRPDGEEDRRRHDGRKRERVARADQIG